MKKFSALAMLLLSFVSLPASASLWDWKINNTTGTFVTSGSDYSAGNYALTDFSVTASSDGVGVGSISGGQYVGHGKTTQMPYDFNWDGNKVTFWNSAGVNTFDWWVFDEVLSTKAILFAWGTGNVNDPTQGAIYDTAVSCCSQPSYLIKVSPGSAVPEPTVLALLSLGLLGLAAFHRRRKATT